MDVLGGVMRSVVEGTIRLLEARAEMKSEFAVEQTMMTADDNNPLKFCIDPGQALERLLGPDRRGYLAPREAFEEAFRDVADHQLALLAGFRDAWNDLLSRLDPEALERRIGKEKGLSGLLASHKARCWDVYCERYRETQEDADRVFRLKVADALETRLRRRDRRR